MIIVSKLFICKYSCEIRLKKTLIVIFTDV